MQAHHHRVVVTGPPERVPVLAVEAWHADLLRVFRPGQRPDALGSHASYFVGHQLGVPVRDQGERDEPPGVSAGPFVDVPVIVGLEHSESEILVSGIGEDLSAELRERREAHRRGHATGVHVIDAGIDVVATGSDLVEACRFDPVLLLGTPRDCVQPEVGDLHALEKPHLPAIVPFDHPRGAGLEPAGETALEHARGLDEVIIDAHDDEVLDRGRCRFGHDGSPVFVGVTRSRRWWHIL